MLHYDEFVLVNSKVSETCVSILMSLEHLEELEISAMNLNVTTEVPLRKLTMFKKEGRLTDFNNLSRAFELMPSLSSLTLEGGEYVITNTAAQRIKQTFHSRGQNVVMYLQEYKMKVYASRKIATYACNSLTSKEFAIFYRGVSINEIGIITMLF